MSKIYIIKHCFYVDGGFGDAVYEEEVVKVTTSEELAKAYVKKWDDPFVYDHPYDDVTMHGLSYEEYEIEYLEEERKKENMDD